MDAATWTLKAAMCIGKEAFSTPQIANKVQRRRAKKRRSYKVKQQVYHCLCCGNFHIGTKPEQLHNTTSGRKRRRLHDIEGDDSMI